MKAIFKQASLVMCGLVLSTMASANTNTFKATTSEDLLLVITVGDSTIQVKNTESLQKTDYTITRKVNGITYAEPKKFDGSSLRIYEGKNLEVFCSALSIPKMRDAYDGAPKGCDLETKAVLEFVSGDIGRKNLAILLK